MPKYIDADVARRIIDSPRSKEQMLLVLSQAEPADVVEVVHGEWKLNNLNGFKIYDCSNCGIHMETRWNYCPHCGADMREEA